MNPEKSELDLPGVRWFGIAIACGCNGFSALLSLGTIALLLTLPETPTLDHGAATILCGIGAAFVGFIGLAAYYLVGGPGSVAGGYRRIDAMVFWMAGAVAIAMLAMIAVAVVLMSFD